MPQGSLATPAVWSGDHPGAAVITAKRESSDAADELVRHRGS